MMRIWKWPLRITDDQIISMPSRAKILTVQMQGGRPHIWALCDERAEHQDRVIHMHGTGNPINGPVGEYVGTFQTDGGALVWHVFDATYRVKGAYIP